MNQPLISIIMPCFNQSQYLSEALQSVLDQTYQDWECIIVNDGSLDNTDYVANVWVSKDNRFKYFKKDNGGVSSARNYGIENSNGEFLLPLDADDKISKSYLELAINEFKKNQHLKIVYSKAEKFGDESGTWYLPSFDISRLGLYNMIFCSGLFRKSEWKRIGGYDTNMVLGLEDWEFWISLLKNGGDVFQMDYIGFYYRIKKSSRQVDLKLLEKKEIFEYMSVKHADFYVKHQGSYIALHLELEFLKKEGYIEVKSKKKVLNVFFKTFFGFYLFKINK